MSNILQQGIMIIPLHDYEGKGELVRRLGELPYDYKKKFIQVILKSAAKNNERVPDEFVFGIELSEDQQFIQVQIFEVEEREDNTRKLTTNGFKRRIPVERIEKVLRKYEQEMGMLN